jgi:hypothetical protein
VPVEKSPVEEIYHKDIELVPMKNPSIDIPVTHKYSVPLPLLPTNLDVESNFVFGNPAWSAKFPLMGTQKIVLSVNKQSIRLPTLVMQVGHSTPSSSTKIITSIRVLSIGWPERNC